jgi:hypothetical protein
MSQTPKLRPQPQMPDQSGEAVAGPRTEGDRRVAAGGDFAVEEFTRRHLVYLLGFTVAAAALRLFNLGTWSFWVDEAHTYRDVLMSPEAFWESGTSRYPISFLMLRWMASVFGFAAADLSEQFMRLPFAFFGIASVPALAVVARGMIGRRAALLASLFLALSPWHIYWSQNARSYSMVLFVSLIAMGTAYYGYHRRSRWQIGAAILLCFLAGLCHPSAYAVVASVFLYVGVSVCVRRDTRQWIGGKWAPLALVALFGVLAILVLPILRHALDVKQSEFSLFHLVQTLVYYVGIPMLVAAGGGMLVLFDRGEKAAAFLTSMMILPMIGLSILSSGGMQKVSAQYAFAVLPTMHMLGAVLVISLASVFRGKGLRPLVLRLVPLAMVVVHMLGQDFLYFEKQHGWRPRWSEAVHYIKVHSRLNGERDLFVLTTSEPCIDYYFESGRHATGRKFDVYIESIEPWSLGNHPEKFLSEVVARARAKNKDLWVVVTEPGLEEKDFDGRADVFLRNNFHQVRRLPNWTGPKDMVIVVYHLE